MDINNVNQNTHINPISPNKKIPITIRKSLSMLMPYFLIISLVWIAIILLWYFAGIPIGPGVSPTL